MRFTFCLLLALSSQEFNGTHLIEIFTNSSNKFCWKRTLSAGKGKLPRHCNDTQEKRGAMCYDRCEIGFHGLGPFCLKKQESYPRGFGKIVDCEPNFEKHGGLCYLKCPSDYKNIGFVCSEKCVNTTPYDCGFGCASSKNACLISVTTQSMSVTVLALNLATLGTLAGMRGTASVALVASKLTKDQQLEAIKAITKKLLKVGGPQLGLWAAQNLAIQLVIASITGQNINWASIEPTGIGAVVQAFKQPICK